MIVEEPWANRQLPRIRPGSISLRWTLNSMYLAPKASSFPSITATTAFSYYDRTRILLSPAHVGGTQAHQHFAGGFVLRRECAVVLNRDMDISEIPLQRIAAIDRVRPRRMEYQIDRANRLVHRMNDRQPRLRYGDARVRGITADHVPKSSNRVDDISSSGIENSLGFTKARLNKGTFAQHCCGRSRILTASQIDERLNRSASNAERVGSGEGKERYDDQPGMIQRSSFSRRLTQKAGMGVGHKDIVDDKILTASASHANNRPCILDCRLVWREPHRPYPRRSRFGQLRLVSVHDDAWAIQPVRIINATGKIPASPDAIGAIDGISPAKRPQRAGTTKIGGLATELTTDFRGNPA